MFIVIKLTSGAPRHQSWATAVEVATEFRGTFYKDHHQEISAAKQL